MMEPQPPPAPPGSPEPGSFESGMKTMYKGMLNVQESTLLTLLVLCSAIEFFAAIGVCNAYHHCGGTYGWAISVGTISLVFSSVLTFLMFKKSDLYEKIAPYGSGFLCVWWVLGAGITTFQGPFITVGNGYFGAWGAFMASFLLAQIRLTGIASWQNVRESFSKIPVGRKNKPPANSPGTHGPDLESAQPGLDNVDASPYASTVSYPPPAPSSYPPLEKESHTPPGPPSFYPNPSEGAPPAPAYEAKDSEQLPTRY
eukprot:CAMPEP_0117656556 /NCGR_PEP_ID=MMETSP0804-20121206/4868_1 /TAXON_ID=1074897 /ORGANISM="Tetraselmis astigmatica, Strain CCMP880" /LENGTH=255 /DNA_ID=CAMNT_0005462967 /DNA_START=150 /DNA_END=917 /DNA_ORIENTATION=+